jgi:hypothetical protein
MGCPSPSSGMTTDLFEDWRAADEEALEAEKVVLIDSLRGIYGIGELRTPGAMAQAKGLRVIADDLLNALLRDARNVGDTSSMSGAPSTIIPSSAVARANNPSCRWLGYSRVFI